MTDQRTSSETLRLRVGEGYTRSELRQVLSCGKSYIDALILLFGLKEYSSTTKQFMGDEVIQALKNHRNNVIVPYEPNEALSVKELEKLMLEMPDGKHE